MDSAGPAQEARSVEAARAIHHIQREPFPSTLFRKLTMQVTEPFFGIHVAGLRDGDAFFQIHWAPMLGPRMFLVIPEDGSPARVMGEVGICYLLDVAVRTHPTKSLAIYSL